MWFFIKKLYSPVNSFCFHCSLSIFKRDCEVGIYQRKNSATRTTVYLNHTSVQVPYTPRSISAHMAQQEVEELVVHLEKSMDLGTMEHGVELVGAALFHRTLNKWGVRNMLRSSWKEMGEIEMKWFRDTTFIITAQDESTAVKILEQVPRAVMKQNFSVK
ncbi:hypothetical protein DVH24_020405 [Malus domestica]|uniref:DUF4283 domain-containing protein n=1 Tax=Malus domestica TaxID=3750 RepID=A0A498JC75_MALDO|nr:hypothetical protein DVH24_020405 [Malus domestica]